jgi:hypothetical protein
VGNDAFDSGDNLVAKTRFYQKADTCGFEKAHTVTGFISETPIVVRSVTIFRCIQTYAAMEAESHLKGPLEERVKSNFIHFQFSLPSGALMCVISGRKREFGRTN